MNLSNRFKESKNKECIKFKTKEEIGKPKENKKILC